MAVKKKKYRIGLWYRRLNDEQKRLVKALYTKQFNVSERVFYHTIQSNSIKAQHLEFFAGLAGTSMEELIADPMRVRPLHEQERISKQELAGLLGLAPPPAP